MFAAPSTPEEFQRRIETEIELYTEFARHTPPPPPSKRGSRPNPLGPPPNHSETGMKMLYFDDYKLGVLKGDTVVDVSSVVRASRTPARTT